MSYKGLLFPIAVSKRSQCRRRLGIRRCHFWSRSATVLPVLKLEQKLLAATSPPKRFRINCRAQCQYRSFNSFRSLLFPAEETTELTASDDVRASDTMQHDYKLAPGAGPVVSPLSEETIHALLSERLRCMVEHNSERLRRIEEQLFEANVVVDDIAKEWRADSIHNANKSRWAFPRARFSVDRSGNGRYLEMEGVRHDYRLFVDAGLNTSTLTEDEIHDLLTERYICRRNRNYERSDSLRTELESHGVYVDDKNKKWRADGLKFVNQSHHYKMAKDSGPFTATISESEIHKLLVKRQYCRINQDFDKEDQLSKYLERCGVSVDDTKFEWRADGVRFAQLQHKYALSPDAGPSRSSMTEAEIHKHLAKHWRYKSLGGFTNTVNWISNVLADAGVFLDEESNEWRADGVRHNYRLSPDAGPNTSSLSEAEIHVLLEKRMRCRWRQDFRNADEIRDQLKLAGVYVDDRNKEWRADSTQPYQLHSERAKALSEGSSSVDEESNVRQGDCVDSNYHFSIHDYRLSPDAGPIASPLAVDEINELLAELHQTQLDADFDEAAHLLAVLRRAGVYVNEKKKEWRADGSEYVEGMSRTP
jgi:hypothetical protein